MALYRLFGLVFLGLLVTGCSASDDGTETADVNDGSATSTPEDALTFYRDIKPITDAHCIQCHNATGIGFFDMSNPETVITWAAAIKASVMSRTMPPYGAMATDTCTPEHQFVGDISLSDEQIATIAEWADAGAELGDANDDVSEPLVPPATLDRFDFEAQANAPIQVEDGDDSFICVVIDPGLTEETWINGIEVVPDNIKLAHHMVLFTDPTRASLQKMNEDGTYPCFGSAGVPGTVLSAWAPGAPPFDFPDDKATRIAPGTLFVMQMHYSPQGGASELIDHTKIRFRYLTEPPKYEVFMQLVGNFDFNFSPALGLQADPNNPEDVKFEIPPGAEMHHEIMRWTYAGQLPGSTGQGGPLAETVKLFSIAPHMHYTGVDMKVWIDRPAPGSTACEPGTLTNAVFCGLRENCPQDQTFVNCLEERCPDEFDAVSLPCWGCGTSAFLNGGENVQQELFACENEAKSAHDSELQANECLLSAPSYSFEWQWNYQYDTAFEALPSLSKGTVMTIDCGYNNTLDNPLLAKALSRAGYDEPITVTQGDETLDEMCLAVMTLVFERDPGEDTP